MRNPRQIDRLIRVTVGLAFLTAALYAGPVPQEWQRSITLALGLLLVVTGLAAHCPASAAFGGRTCPAPAGRRPPRGSRPPEVSRR